MKRFVVSLILICLVLSLSGCKSQEVKNVETMIDAIGVVSWDNLDQISEADRAYHALTDEDKADVDNLNVLKEAVDDAFDLECKDAQEAVDLVMALFDILSDYFYSDEMSKLSPPDYQEYLDHLTYDDLSLDQRPFSVFFQESHIEDQIWKIIDIDSLFASEFTLKNLFKLLSPENTWYELIAIPGVFDKIPLYWYDSNFPRGLERVEAVRGKFKDPDSVSCTNAWICFKRPDGAEDGGDFLLFDSYCYKIYAEIRAKNSFGGYVVEIYDVTTSTPEKAYMYTDLLGFPVAPNGYTDWLTCNY